MPIDEIDDIEVLRALAKKSRVKINNDIPAFEGDYVFKKGYWYLMSQDENGVYLFSEDYKYEAVLTYNKASEYID